MELKDRLPATLDIETDTDEVGPPDGKLRDDVLSALLNLGYHRPLAERAVEAALTSTAGAEGFEHALRQALRELAK